jgi:hypothetical protein
MNTAMRPSGGMGWQKFAGVALLLALVVGGFIFMKNRHFHGTHPDEAKGKDGVLSKVVIDMKVPLKETVPSVATAESVARKIASGSRASTETSYAPSEYFLFDDSYEDKDFNRNKDICRRVEYRGDGYQHSQISKANWKKVLAQFEQSRELLKTWLAKNQGKITDSLSVYMEEQLQEIQLVAPPSMEEPDLSWRGIGTWTRDEAGKPLIRLGGGFIKLVLKQPKRAQFEMTRLIAQSWAPCELQKVDSKNPWEKLTACLEVTEEQACSSGSYSEAGWAMSSSLAMMLSPPGCKLPIFVQENKTKCLQALK